MTSTKITAIKIFCAVIYILFILGTLVAVGDVGQYVDFLAFLFVGVVALLFAASAQGEESIAQKFGIGAVRAGWLGSIIGIIAIFGSDGFVRRHVKNRPGLSRTLTNSLLRLPFQTWDNHSGFERSVYFSSWAIVQAKSRALTPHLL